MTDEELALFKSKLSKYGDCREWLGALCADDARPSRIAREEREAERLWCELVDMAMGREDA